MRALSIRQPWAWAILFAGKDVENRGWSTRYRGRILVHASLGCTREEYESACEFIRDIHPQIEIPSLAMLPRGAIVGAVTIIGCATHSTSPWFDGPVGLMLERPRAVQPVACKGQLQIFRVPADVEAQLKKQAV